MDIPIADYPPRHNETFRKIWGYENPKYSEYFKLASTPTRSFFSTNYDSTWSFLKSDSPATYNMLAKMLEGQTLVDFGSGRRKLLGNLGEAANKITLKIDIDKFPFGQAFPGSSPEPEILEEGDSNIIIQGDNLLAAAKIKSDSVVCSINGVDWFSKTNNEYQKALAQELVRITKKGGTIFGVDSDILETMHIFEKELEEKTFRGTHGTRYYIFVKK